jgi:hypothetical protein
MSETVCQVLQVHGYSGVNRKSVQNFDQRLKWVYGSIDRLKTTNFVLLRYLPFGSWKNLIQRAPISNCLLTERRDSRRTYPVHPVDSPEHWNGIWQRQVTAEGSMEHFTHTDRLSISSHSSGKSSNVTADGLLYSVDTEWARCRRSALGIRHPLAWLWAVVASRAVCICVALTLKKIHKREAGLTSPLTKEK